MVEQFLKEKGIKSNEVSFQAIDIQKDYTHSYDNAGNSFSSFNGYILTQYVSVEPKDLDKVVSQASREISELFSNRTCFYKELDKYRLSKERNSAVVNKLARRQISFPLQ